jgi:hypothetical protein
MTDPGTMEVLSEYHLIRRVGGSLTGGTPFLSCSGFAFVLENLETEFYKQGLSKFKSSDFSNAGFTSGDSAVEEITTIQVDESTHVTALEVCIRYSSLFIS